METIRIVAVIFLFIMIPQFWLWIKQWQAYVELQNREQVKRLKDYSLVHDYYVKMCIEMGEKPDKNVTLNAIQIALVRHKRYLKLQKGYLN